MAAIAVNTGRAARRARRPPGRRADPRGAVIGRPRLHLRATPSTNDRARELALAGAPHGTLVSAGVQTAGRGRQGRAWAAPPGSALLLLARAARARRRCCRCAPGSPSPTSRARTRRSSGRTTSSSTGASSRACSSRRGRRRAGRCWGSASTSRSTRPSCRRRCATARRRSGGRAARSSPRWTSSCARSPRGWTQPARDCLAALRARDALLGRPVRWAGGAGTGAGIDDGGALLVRRPDGTLAALAAGEVHLEG